MPPQGPSDGLHVPSAAVDEDFRFSNPGWEHLFPACCRKAGCTNITEQCGLRKLHMRQLKQAGGTPPETGNCKAFPRA